MASKRVTVFGGSGFLGRQIVKPRGPTSAWRRAIPSAHPSSNGSAGTARSSSARLVRDGYLPRSGDEDDAAPTPAAARQRRHRARRKQGRFVVPVEVSCAMITALVDQGDVDEANSTDLDCVGKAITAAARRGLDLT